jgi:hypothetical protein
MNTPNQDKIQDSTAQEDPAAAGFSTAPQYECDKAQPKKSTFDILNQMAGGLLPPGTPIVQTETLPDFNDRVEPETEEPAFAGFGPLGAVVPQIGGPVVEPVAASVSSVEDAVQLLRQEIAAAWGQDHVDDAAFAKVSHLTIVQVASANSPLIVADPVCDDEVMLGTSEDGVQAVLGNTNITAAQALSRAQLAMTSARFKAEGVNEVHGTAMDKALLLLAAQDVGLTIVNEPEISGDVMREAQKQWDALKAQNAPVAEPVAAEPVAVEPATTEAVAETPVSEVTEELATSVPEEQPVAAAANVKDFLQGVDVTELPDDGIPVLTDVVHPDELQALLKAEAATTVPVKPEVQKILDGETENDRISPEVYLDLRSRIKAGDTAFADDKGFILRSGITEAFREQGIGTGRTQRLLEALEADGVTYTSTRVEPAPRTLVNYQVALRPGLRPE